MSVRAAAVARRAAAVAAILGSGLAVPTAGSGAPTSIPGPLAGPATSGPLAGPGIPGSPAAQGGARVLRCEPIRVPLVPTGAGLGAAGYLELVMASSPFGVTVEADGRYVYELTVRVQRLRRRPHELYVAWATTPELDRVVRLGVVGEDGTVRGRLAWNKFLVLVSAETEADGERWSGPILLTGLSPSGRMHTMRGHGIFEAHGIGC